MARSYIKKSLKHRLLSRVTINKEDCWIINGSQTDKGYSRFTINYKMYTGHRASWIIHNGPIPNKLCVLHKCDTPLCVNPNHLFLGTRADNVYDMVNKDRHTKGENNKNAKFTPDKVVYIRYLQRNSKLSNTFIAKIFNTTQQTISAIKHKIIWKHVK